jgi:hypothetical protein
VPVGDGYGKKQGLVLIQGQIEVNGEIKMGVS